MIKTITGTTIDCDALSEQLNEKLRSQISFSSDCQINCYQEDNWLIISLNLESTETISKIIELIRETVNEMQIISDFIIANHQEVYFASQEDYPPEIINNLFPAQESYSSGKKYASANFSNGLIIFILSALSISILGVFYYFSRPCVMEEQCDLISSINSSISQTLKDKTQTELTQSQIKDLQLEVNQAIEQLNRIPRWSSYHSESTLLISHYKQILQELNYFLKADKLASNAENMSKQLPLSSDEWQRVKNFLEDAIEQLNLIATPDFDSEKQNLINNYNQQISSIDQSIEREEIGREKLLTVETIIQQIEQNQNSIKSIADLEKIEQQWQIAIKEIESIPKQTTAAKKQDNLLNTSLQEIINIQAKITAEQEATNLFNIAQENIQLAQDSEQENQWTKAVSFWEKALNSLNSIPADSLYQEQVSSLKTITQQELGFAQEALKQAITRNKIQEELKTICTGIENICTYQIDKKKSQFF